ncbi:MAG: hypothetical protein A4E74_00999 [Syntrophus sp. PtaB.Bin075]|nr:MAG: hypothetical protein A4E74_00999 [Syntrophus sp. PtaB.Bin075]
MLRGGFPVDLLSFEQQLTENYFLKLFQSGS